MDTVKHENDGSYRSRMERAGAFYSRTAQGMKQKEEESLVSRPPHYSRWKIEPITYIMRNGMEFWRGNIVKYATRAGFKKYPDMSEQDSEITDLKKVIRYAEMRINQLKGEVEL